jgi:hypothetical protein
VKIRAPFENAEANNNKEAMSPPPTLRKARTIRASQFGGSTEWLRKNFRVTGSSGFSSRKLGPVSLRQPPMCRASCAISGWGGHIAGRGNYLQFLGPRIVTMGILFISWQFVKKPGLDLVDTKHVSLSRGPSARSPLRGGACGHAPDQTGGTSSVGNAGIHLSADTARKQFRGLTDRSTSVRRKDGPGLRRGSE